MSTTEGSWITEALYADNLSYLAEIDNETNELFLDSILKRGASSYRELSIGESRRALGSLDLPVELLNQILLDLDISSFLAFRLVNRRAVEIAGALPEYRTIVQCAPNTLRGIQVIETGAFITINQLYNALFTASCVECRGPGRFINLLTLDRFCFGCIGGNKRHRLIEHHEVSARWLIDKDTFETLPMAKFPPGAVAKWTEQSEKRVYVHPQHAFEAAIAKWGSYLDMISAMTMAQLDAFDSWHAIHSETRSYHSSPVHLPHDPTTPEDIDYKPCIRMPFVDRATKEVHWGYRCLACRTMEKWPFVKHTVFETKEEFVDHLWKQPAGSYSTIMHQWMLKCKMREAIGGRPTTDFAKRSFLNEVLT